MNILTQSILGETVTLKHQGSFYWLVEPIKCYELSVDSSGSLDDVKKYIQRKIKSLRKNLSDLDKSETEVIAIYQACLSDWQSLYKKVTRLTKRASDGLKSPAKKQSSTAGSKSPAKKRKVTSRA
jgi:Fe-S oxidoreductase